MKIKELAFVTSAAVILIGTICAAALYWHPIHWKSVVGLESVSNEKIWRAFSWRARLYRQKAKGGVPELSCSELWELTRPESGFYWIEGTSMEASLLYSSYASASDREAGARIFRERCTRCHGGDGSGGLHGPSLARSGYKRGDSDLAIYRVLRDGIPGTAMPSAGLPLRELLQLRIRWIKQFDTNDPVIEGTPLVSDGVIFIAAPAPNVLALDAKTGDVIWEYERPIPADLPLCCGRNNRRLAVHGSTIFLGSLDGYLVAINANDGKVIWQTLVASPSDGYSITGAPLIVDRSVVVGIAGGEFGIRGFLAAYDVSTGQQQWKFQTIPGPGEVGHETWEDDAWRTGGGPTWNTGSYDPSMDLLYWGVGNASPDYSWDVRPGDNLFTDSVIALHARTGKLAWYFQFTPHDEHDWDSSQTPVLADLLINGVVRKVICWPNRNGFYYVLDRVTGEFLVGVPFVELDWAKGLTSAGRPILSDTANVSAGGRLTKPDVGGGTNWQNPAFDPIRGSIFVPATESNGVFTKRSPNRAVRGQLFLGSGGTAVVDPPPRLVRALDAATGRPRKITVVCWQPRGD